MIFNIKKLYRVFGTKRKWLVLMAVISSTAMLYIDQTAISVMLPQLKAHFDLSFAAQQWVINSFFLAIVVFIAVAGRCIDIYGVKKSFLVGIFGFLIASTLCGLATNIACLMIGRVLQGVFGSLLLTTATVNIANAFPSKQAPFAMGLYIGVASIFLVIGPFLGGVLTQLFNWRYVFLINIPIAFCALFTGSFIRNYKKSFKKIKSFDWLGVIVLGIANTTFVFALMEGESFGWTSSLIISLLFFAFIAYLLFVKIEITAPFPLVDFAIFKNKQYFIASMVLFCMQFCIITRIFLAITFQLAFSKSPTIAGLLVFPATLPIIFMAPLTGRLLKRFGLRKMLYAGTSCVMLSFVWLIFFIDPDSYLLLFIGLLLFGISFPLAMNPSIAVSVIGIDQPKRGMASGIVNQMRQLASTLAVAVMGVITSHFGQYNYISSMKEQFPKVTALQNVHINDILINSSSITREMTSNLGQYDFMLIHKIAAQAYLSGFKLSILATIIFIIVAIILIWRVRPSDVAVSEM